MEKRESYKFSAALCRGLIEAERTATDTDGQPRTFSAALCRGLIEARRALVISSVMVSVFRGFMPRPH